MAIETSEQDSTAAHSRSGFSLVTNDNPSEGSYLASCSTSDNTAVRYLKLPHGDYAIAMSSSGKVTVTDINSSRTNLEIYEVETTPMTDANGVRFWLYNGHEHSGRPHLPVDLSAGSKLTVESRDPYTPDDDAESPVPGGLKLGLTSRGDPSFVDGKLAGEVSIVRPR